MKSHTYTAVSKILCKPCNFHNTAHVNPNTVFRTQLCRPHERKQLQKVNTIHMKAKWFKPRIPSWGRDK